MAVGTTGDSDIAKLLIENGANVNARDIYGLTPYHTTGDSDIAKLLIKNGADVKHKINPQVPY